MSAKLIFDPTTGELIVAEKSAADQRQTQAPFFEIRKPREAQSPAIELALRSDNVRIQLDMLHALTAAGGDYNRFTLQVLPLLQHENYTLREAALEALTHTGYAADCKPTLESFLQSPNLQLRKDTLRLCRNWGVEVRPLASLVLQTVLHENPQLREAALAALETVGFHASILPLAERLLLHGSAEQRILLLQALQRCGATAAAALPLVLQRLNDQHDEVVEQAIVTFRAIGFHASGLREVVRLLGHANRRKRLHMLELLHASGRQAQAAAAGVLSLMVDDDDNVALLAWKTLDVIGYCEALLKPLEALRHHPDWAVRSKVLDRVEAYGAEAGSAASLVAAMMGDSDYAVREKAERLFRRLGFRHDVLPEIQRLLRNPNWEARLLVLKALREMGPSAVTTAAAVATKLEDKNPDVAAMAHAALKSIGYHEAAQPVFKKLIRQLRQDRKLMLISCLKHYGPTAQDCLECIVTALGDRDGVVRDAAVEAFVTIGYDDAVLPQLQKLSKDYAPEIRLSLVQALAACGQSAHSARTILQTCQDDKHWDVARAARDALSALP